jgi:hypothetical protein
VTPGRIEAEHFQNKTLDVSWGTPEKRKTDPSSPENAII